MQEYSFECPLGVLTLKAREDAIYSLELNAFGHEPQNEPPEGVLAEAKKQLLQYFDGKLREFSLPLAPKGSAFQQQVWQALRRIPYGGLRSYREVAEDVGSPGGFRAVGLANNKNPLPILIPCHRVVGSDGNLVGYRYGLDVKQWLLELEGIRFDSPEEEAPGPSPEPQVPAPGPDAGEETPPGEQAPRGETRLM